MKKIGVLLIFLILAFSFVLAQGNESETENSNLVGVDKAYECLQDEIDDKSESQISLQEAVFGTLALGSQSKLNSVISDEEGNDCWPSDSCTIKDTAQVLLAQERINKNTQDIESWLLDHADTATELSWFLQIDISNHDEASCTVSYDNDDRTININEDQTVSGNPGSCFSISSSGFWLRINNNCIDEDFRVSCDQDFVTSLLYQRQGSQTVFISPSTNSAAALGTTEESVSSECFSSSGNSCDYEGTLWAAIALDQAGEDVSSYLPYLLALSEENQKFFPSAFLHIITQGEDQYSQIVQSQQQNQFWQVPNSPNNRFYDTSLAMLSLQGTGAQELASSKDYLLSIQTPEGCWNNNNIRDTAFALYSGWSKTVPGSVSGTSSGESCEAEGHSCVSSLFSCADAGGQILDFDCDFGVCCSVSLIPPTCAEQDGIICSASQTCSGIEVNSIEGSCCLDSCQELPRSNECQLIGGGCFASCNSNEEQTSDSCDSPGLVCCVGKTETSSGGGIGLWTWVIILLILIIIVALAIWKRKELQLWFHKLRSKRGKSKPGSSPQQRRPPRPPYGPGQLRRPIGARPRPGMPRGAPPRRPPQRRGLSKTDKELEETLKKLKKMSE